jgi:mono/diheme cytochrome c family protein
MHRILLLTSIAVLTACNSAHNDHDHPDLVSGKELYEHHRSDCHGQGGQGNLLKGIPSNLFTQFNQSELADLIVQGRKHEGRNMPVMEKMSNSEARKIVTYLWHLRSQFENTEQDRRMMVKPGRQATSNDN